MTTGNKGNVKISGAGTADGGVYEKVSVSGAGKITGDIEADKISISGAGKIDGSVRAGTFTASGASEIRGDLEAKTARCSGATKISGNVTAGELKFSGASKVGGNCKAEKVKALGACKFNGDLEAEQLCSAGAFHVAGLVSADEIELAIGGDCRASEIGGGRVTVVQAHGKHSVWPWLWRKDNSRLRAETIEGDDVYLEATTASCVRGRRVRIGSHCRVTHVEFSESLEIDPSAEGSGHQYTGSETAPAVGRNELRPPEGWARDRAAKGGAWGDIRFGLPIRNPVLRALAAILGLVIAAVVIIPILSIVFPAVAVLLLIVLGGVAALLIALAVGVPLLVIAAIAVKLLLLPLEMLGWVFGRHRRRSG